MGHGDFAGVAAALPETARAERERPFWQALADLHRWQRVVDAGCGGGFHLRLLRGLGVRAVGVDVALAPLPAQRGAAVLVADLLAMPLAAGRLDAVLCLGNTLSLLPDRGAQRCALAGLKALLRPGGLLVAQAEDAGVTVREGARLRARSLPDGRVHVRAFVRRGRRVQMLAGVARPGEEAGLEVVWLLPTSAARLVALARPLGLVPAPLPPPPGGAAGSWWLALMADATGR